MARDSRTCPKFELNFPLLFSHRGSAFAPQHDHLPGMQTKRLASFSATGRTISTQTKAAGMATI